MCEICGHDHHDEHGNPWWSDYRPVKAQEQIASVASIVRDMQLSRLRRLDEGRALLSGLLPVGGGVAGR